MKKRSLSQNSPSTKKPRIYGDKIELFDKEGNSRGFYSLKNRLNDLTGKEWQYWSKSVINKQYPPNLQHKLRSKHGAQKPPQLCADLIQAFTKKGQSVLDPFMGVGGTLLGAGLCKRVATGIEINPKWIEIYYKVCKLERIKKQRAICGDSKVVLKRLRKKFDFVLTDVPFWKMDKVKKSKGKFKKVGEETKKPLVSKLSKFNNQEAQTKSEWENEMRQVFNLTMTLLKNKGYLAVFIGDMYWNGRYHFLSNDLANILGSIGYIPKANLIWYDVSKKLRIYGYQYEFIPSMIHQNILVFRKEARRY